MQGDFVVQIKPGMDVVRGQFQGRVEHIDSGFSARFESVNDLLAFIARAMAASAPPKKGDAPNNLTAL